MTSKTITGLPKQDGFFYASRVGTATGGVDDLAVPPG